MVLGGGGVLLSEVPLYPAGAGVPPRLRRLRFSPFSNNRFRITCFHREQSKIGISPALDGPHNFGAVWKSEQPLKPAEFWAPALWGARIVGSEISGTTEYWGADIVGQVERIYSQTSGTTELRGRWVVGQFKTILQRNLNFWLLG